MRKQIGFSLAILTFIGAIVVADMATSQPFPAQPTALLSTAPQLDIPDLIARGRAVAARRSGEWPTLRKHHLLKQPVCQMCGGSKKLQVHHIRPFHLHPELELDPNNLITLCEAPGKDCHLRYGHNGNFHDGYNLMIVSDCAKHRAESEGNDH